MSATFEDLRVLQSAEEVADKIWEQVVGWEVFAKEVVGGQLARAADSIGANIAESFGRFHFGEKLQFLYYARGSLFETKYWLNCALTRELIISEQAQIYITQLTELVRQLNAFTSSLKAQRKKSSSLRETSVKYTTLDGQHSIAHPEEKDGKDLEAFIGSPAPLFNEAEIEWLQTIPKVKKNV